MKNILWSLLILTSCVNPEKHLKSELEVQSVAGNKKVVEIDSISYLQLNKKISKLDYFDTTQHEITNTKMIDEYSVFLTSEVKNPNLYKLYYNEMISSMDTIFILMKNQNFYRYIKKDFKTKLIFDSYIADTRSLPKRLKHKLLNLTTNRSKALMINDSTFSSSLMINFKKDTIQSLIFINYLD
jgi:hypothetical protein